MAISLGRLTQHCQTNPNGGDGGWVLHAMIRVWNGYGRGVWNEMDLNFQTILADCFGDRFKI